VSFSRRSRVPGARAFARRLATATLVLDPRSLMLHRGSRIYLNGESLAVRGRLALRLKALADARRAPGRGFRETQALLLLHDWYRAGFIHLE
jgi:50S ribosomal protein L16 3-hydroxylase